MYTELDYHYFCQHLSKQERKNDASSVDYEANSKKSEECNKNRIV